MKIHLLHTALAAVLSCLMFGQLQAQVTTQTGGSNAPLSAKGLVQKALAEGESKGWITGPLAQGFNKQLGLTQAQDKVYSTWKRLKKFDSDCGRFTLVLEQPGMVAKGKDGKDHPARFGIDINICADGSPPKTKDGKPIPESMWK